MGVVIAVTQAEAPGNDINPQVAVPAGAVAGDVFALFWGHLLSSTGQWPAGFTDTGALSHEASVVGYARAATKVADGTESGFFTGTTDSYCKWNAVCVLIRGVSTTLDAAVPNQTYAYSSSADMSGAAISTNGPSRTIVQIAQTLAGGNSAGAGTYSGPSGFTTAFTKDDGLGDLTTVTWGTQDTAGSVAYSASASFGSVADSRGTTIITLAFGPSGFTRRALVSIGGQMQEMVDADTVDVPALGQHACLDGLDGDNHTQYLNLLRGDARYAALGHTHNGSNWLSQGGASIGDVVYWDGTTWTHKDETPINVLRTSVSTAQQSTTTALASVTQLALPLRANGVYRVECEVTFQTVAATTGLNLGFTSPSDARCMLEVVVPLTSTAAASQLRIIFPNAATAVNTGNVLGTGVTAANSNQTARMSGIVRAGATEGLFQVQFATEVNASAVTIQPGSYLEMTRIA